MSAWLLIPAWYGVASVVSLVLYAWDKRRARRGGWRTREKTLHLVDLAGGWPGGLAARRLLRHKTRDVRFRVLFWLIVALHVVVWGAVAYAAWR